MSYVFDDPAARTLEGGADRRIPAFDYLNTSKRIEADRVRALIDDFMARYPGSGQDKLRARLRSRDEINHKGAFFELAIHELLLRAGCTAALHPPVPDTSKTPDFLVETPSSDRFYLEATLATGRSKADEGQQKLLARALQTVDEVPSPDFFLSVFPSGMPSAAISGRKLRSDLARWINSLEYNSVGAELAAGRSPPSMVYNQHGARFESFAIPRGSTRGRDGGSIGLQSFGAGLLHTAEPIRDAVKGKATRYGQLDLPYVIAVGALDDFADEDDALDALFGTRAVGVTRMPDGSYHTATSANTTARCGAPVDPRGPG
jgi:hypothetical protein